MNKFEHVLYLKGRGAGPGPRIGMGSLYGEVQCIMGNGHKRPPPPPIAVDRITGRND